MSARAVEAVTSAVQRKYAVVPGDVVAHCTRAVAVWLRSGFGIDPEAAMQERYHWFYAQNPQGPGQINFLEADGEEHSLGSLGIGARNWVVGSEDVPGGVLVDFVVHPAHRTAAPALMLQRESRARAGARAAILIGIPEAKAVAIFKRLGSQLHRPFPRFVRVLGFTGYLKHHVPWWIAVPLGRILALLDRVSVGLQLLFVSLDARWVESFDERFDALWREVDKRRLCIGVRDARFLEWRFGRQPGHSYRTLIVGAKDGRSLNAYFVCEFKESMLHVKDFLIAGGARQLRRALLMLISEARSLGANAVSIQLLGNEQIVKALRRLHFVERDSRPFFAMATGEAAQKVSQCDWYITQADEDI